MILSLLLLLALLALYAWAVCHSRDCGGYPCGPDQPTYDDHEGE